jgi:xylose dehydrogenase (NAD/NADP)
MAQTLRWGILGTGNIAGKFAAAVSKSERTQTVAVGSRSPETARMFAQQFHISTATGYDELLSAADVDAVYIALPNSLHHKWAIKALLAGKHVLCEKPLAHDLEQSEEMFDAAEISGRLLVEAFMYRSHPLTQTVIEAVRAGAIGKLKLIRTSFCFNLPQTAGNIRFKSGLGGGALMDVGCYCINFSRLFAGEEPSQMAAMAHIHDSGVDDVAAGTMTFPNGIVASFTCGMTAQADNAAYLCGDEGYIEVPIPWKPPVQQAEFTIVRGVHRNTQHVDADNEPYALEADDFAAAALDGKPPAITRQDTLGNMRVLDEMRLQIVNL